MALTADRLQVDGNVFCWQEFDADGNVFSGDGFEADGQVGLVGGQVGGDLHLTGGKFRNRRGMALNADRLVVNQSVYCREGFEAYGEVSLQGGHAGGDLELSGGTFRNEGGTALNAARVSVDGRLQWEPAEVKGKEVSFAFCKVGVWADSTAALALDTPLALHGLRYDGLYPPDVTAKKRVAWLDRDPQYAPQPFSQLASAYRAEGHDRAARQVLVASQTRRYREKSGWHRWPEKAWGGLLWVTVGYGYRPWLALLWLAALVAGGSLIVNALPDQDFEEGSGAPPFNSLLYTIDELLPFIDLGYDKWVTDGDAAQFVTVALVLLGWVLATAVIAAFGGVLRRGD